jgi:uncharacterized flavoprotein (TIGR03862 family)
MNPPASVAIIGAGPAGLMAAEILAGAGISVHVYDAMPSAGRKFLVAGKGGLNLTHSEPLDQFLTRYGDRRIYIEPLLRAFDPEDMRQWAASLGIETFVGTSGRVFPIGMKSAPLLRLWLARLKSAGVVFHFRHRWIGWDETGVLSFETHAGKVTCSPNAAVLALGGASWPVTGSTGEWVSLLSQRGIPIEPFKPSNCGFEVKWTSHFRSRFAGHPIKAVVASFTDSRRQTFHQQGEFIITDTGVEGSLIYACSALLRDEIDSHRIAVLHLDLAPGYTHERLLERLARPRGSRSMAAHLERSIGFKGVKAGLLWEFVPKEDFKDPERLAAAIKDLPIPLITTRPIEEAISSAGGIPFEAVDEQLMLKALPGTFCAGEMLDWEAPTGGYLLTACFASGRMAGLGAIQWLQTL